MLVFVCAVSDVACLVISTKRVVSGGEMRCCGHEASTGALEWGCQMRWLPDAEVRPAGVPSNASPSASVAEPRSASHRGHRLHHPTRAVLSAISTSGAYGERHRFCTEPAEGRLAGCAPSSSLVRTACIGPRWMRRRWNPARSFLCRVHRWVNHIPLQTGNQSSPSASAC